MAERRLAAGESTDDPFLAVMVDRGALRQAQNDGDPLAELGSTACSRRRTIERTPEPTPAKG